jgi:hypothetical protein
MHKKKQKVANTVGGKNIGIYLMKKKTWEVVRMRKKRIWLLILCLVLVTVWVSGCGESKK